MTKLEQGWAQTNERWYLEKWKVKDLHENPKNPRTLTKHDMAQLTKSMDKFGIIERPIVNKNGQIIGGHQRVKLLKKAKIKEIECWTPFEEMTQEDCDELCIRLNKNQGKFDYDMLANEFDIPDLLDWGFTMNDIDGCFDAADESPADEDKCDDEKCDACGQKVKKKKVRK